MMDTKAPAPLPKALVVIIRPFQAFFRTTTSGGLVLLVATLIALAWANSPWAESYEGVFSQPFALRFGSYAITWPLRRVIDDALMTVFFFLVGMEIKHELLAGELRSLSRAILPALAAAGGMIVPALLFVLSNRSGEARAGWGIPMATDIAFALGCVAVLGDRIAAPLRVFLAAFAIFDDLGAIVVIALFYGHSVSFAALGVAALLVVVLIAMNRFGARSPLAYTAVGLALWLAVLRSGVHATLAGVVLGMCIPARPPKSPKAILNELRHEMDALCTMGDDSEGEAAAVAALEHHLEDVQPPLARMVHALHGWVAFLVVPIFALANAGIQMSRTPLAHLVSPVCLGVACGLFFGKQIGIGLTTLVAVRLGISPRPVGSTWLQLYGVAVLGGIGFTMSMFLSELAFDEGHSALVSQAKIGILLGSALSAVVGTAILALAPRPRAA